MGRAPCCDKANVKKGPWSPEEDAKLKDYIDKNGTGGNWIALPHKVGLKRCGKSCRLRWLNYLRPNIKHGEFSEAEDRIICSLYATIGSRWSIIASQLPGRTDNDIKNYWNTKLKKKMMTMNHQLPQPQSQRKQPQQITLLSMFQNSTSSSPSSSSSPPLSFRDSNSNNSPYYHPHHQGSNNFNNNASGSYSSYSSSILSGNSSNNSANSNFQSQESYLCHTQNNSMFVLGGEATSCSSSDGSCNNKMNNNNNNNNNHVIEAEFGDGTFVDQISVANYLYNVGGVEDTQNLMVSNNNNAGGSVVSGLIWGENNPMDYGLEEIKELISSTSTSNNFLFDEKKTEESVLYYSYG